MVLKTAEMSFSVVDKMEDATVSVLLEIVHSDHFNFGVFKSARMHEIDCEDIVPCNVENFMNEIEF